MNEGIPITDRWSETGVATVTITAPTVGRLILQSIAVDSDAACDITIESPLGTNIQRWTIPAAGGVGDSYALGAGIIGAETSAMIISVSAGNYNINVSGITVG